MKYARIAFLILCMIVMPRFAGATSALEKYAFGGQIRILIVPGHDADYSGAVYQDTKEADMTLPLAQKIAELLNTNPRFSATLARTEAGYIPELADYFQNTDEIADFIDEHAQATAEAIENGDINVVDGVQHNNAPSLVVTRLYGINKWAAENGYDIILHIHFNDSYPRDIDAEGEATGFSIYTPDPSLPNYQYAKVFGDALGERLKRSILLTSLPLEQGFMDQSGAIEDQKLIAVGAKGTLTIPSVLVEYSYIYEPMLHGDLFPVTSDVMAHATVYGITEYFSGIPLANKNLTYEWNETMKRDKSGKASADVLALQFALHELGLYPPVSGGRDACPFIGVFGPCTEKAVQEFQRLYGLVPDGIIGVAGLAKLNAFF